MHYGRLMCCMLVGQHSWCVNLHREGGDVYCVMYYMKNEEK